MNKIARAARSQALSLQIHSDYSRLRPSAAPMRLTGRTAYGQPSLPFAQRDNVEGLDRHIGQRVALGAADGRAHGPTGVLHSSRAQRIQAPGSSFQNRHQFPLFLSIPRSEFALGKIRVPFPPTPISPRRRLVPMVQACNAVARALGRSHLLLMLSSRQFELQVAVWPALWDLYAY